MAQGKSYHNISSALVAQIIVASEPQDEDFRRYFAAPMWFPYTHVYVFLEAKDI